jgi:ribonuclease P protein component
MLNPNTPSLHCSSAPPPRRFRFPKSARLTRSSEFAKVKNAGESCHGRLMVLSVLKTAECEPRIGLITSRRLGNAVKRNAVRRRLREIVRLERPRLKPGLWLVFVARKAAAGAPFEALREDWLRLAKRASIFENQNDVRRE